MEASEPNLAPDQATIQATPGRSSAIALIGYLGETSTVGYVRLYQNLSLESWLEIRDADIVDRAAADGGDDVTVGESILWVRRDAEIVYGGSAPWSDFEGLGGGGDSKAYRYPRG
jgi:hypothetical protein